MFELNHDAIMQTCSLISPSGTERTLTEVKGPVGWCSLQTAILLAYLPHIPQLISFFTVTKPREFMEPFISSVYGPGHTDEYAVVGFLDVSEPQSACTLNYFLVFASILYTYIFFTRRTVLRTLAACAENMSWKTREMHQSLIKVLSVHSLLPTCTMLGFLAMFLQMADIYHSVECERSIYTIATFPSVVNPLLTLY
ncbi:hypothetical protein PMAYCL1PPCAC_22312, partial [Pristionchus mayeri]